MKQNALKLISIFVILGMALGLFGAKAVEASARTTSWAVSVTYLNVDDSEAQIVVDFYAEGSDVGITYSPANLPVGAAASFYIGSVGGITGGFKGNAVISSNASLVATVVQFHENTAGESIRMRMLSNGFDMANTSDTFLIPTTLLSPTDRTTVFSIQNTENAAIVANVKFYSASTGALAGEKNFNIPALSSHFVDMDDLNDTGLPSGTTNFDGSAVVTAKLASDNTTPAKVVSTISELYNTKDVGGNFEGVPFSKAASKVYMATALCQPGQPNGLQTFYAVQNADLNNSATIRVTYYNTDGTEKTTDGPYTIGKGQKKSIITCSPNSGVSMSGFTGSAIIQAEGENALTAKLVAIGKAQPAAGSGSGVSTLYAVFMGEPDGASKLALPLVRWANDTHYNSATNYGGYQRSYLAIQNIGDTTAKVDVIYKDKNGETVATHTLTIDARAKANSTPSVAGALGLNGMVAGEFGYYNDKTFGGGVIIQANAENPTAKFIALVRSQNPGAGEDYNAVPVP